MSAARISRRDLLVGGGALVAGAAGTEIGNVLASSGGGPGVGPYVASPGEELMVEHGVLKRVLLAYRTIADQLAAGHAVAADTIVDAAQIIAGYVESFHEGLEEAYVFPRVRQQQGALVRTLLVQHDRGRHLTEAILSAAPDATKQPKARATLLSALRSFVRMYEPHEAWEDTVIYPALRQVSTQHTLDLLAERFADLENKQFGGNALGQMLHRLTGVEQQLNIHDLDAFTPPAT